MDKEISAFSSYNSIENKKSKKPGKLAEKKSKPSRKKKVTENDANPVPEKENNTTPSKQKKSPKKRKRNQSAESNVELPIRKKTKGKVPEDVDDDGQKISKKKAKKTTKKIAALELVDSENTNPAKSKQINGRAEDDESEEIVLEKNCETLDVQERVSKKKVKKKDKKNTNATVNKEPVDHQVADPSSVYTNSIEEGASLLSWLLSPISIDEFFRKYWEKDVLMVAQRTGEPFKHFISFEMIDQMLLENHVEFTKNIDITSYKNGSRQTHNPDGRAMPPAVWEQYSNGHSIRLLNPQTFLPSIFSLCTTLQEYFHCMVGANVYLTPPNSQGFAPHYDDIEAFVLQIEGRKRWKLYKPRCQEETLPRTSSKNFSQNEIGEPILEHVLCPGDVLYFPRGTIHQACTEPGYHSLHITVSVYQKQSYADLFEQMLPIMIRKAIANSVDMRRGLPLNIWRNAGIVYADIDTKQRQDFFIKCREMMSKLIQELPVDDAIDQMAKKFHHEALPPELTEDEINRTIFGSKSILDENGECLADYEITLESKIRLLRAHIIHLVEEDNVLRLYYYSDNSREYREYKANFIEINREDASSIDYLIKSYPEYISVSELPVDDDEGKLNISLALWEYGLLILENPINQK